VPRGTANLEQDRVEHVMQHSEMALRKVRDHIACARRLLHIGLLSNTEIIEDR